MEVDNEFSRYLGQWVRLTYALEDIVMMTVLARYPGLLSLLR